jgi:hypothetical protein
MRVGNFLQENVKKSKKNARLFMNSRRALYADCSHYLLTHLESFHLDFFLYKVKV